MIENPPIYDILTNTCGNNSNQSIQCFEYSSNNTCLKWNVTIDNQSGQITDIQYPDTTDSMNCNSSALNCWDGWTDWSPCAGTCDEAYQWRRQSTSMGVSSCRQPPAYEYQSCNLTNCCTWVYNDSISWSNCTAPCGNGIQMRMPYTCSCGDEYQCPSPDNQFFETQPCETNDTCCTFDIESEPTQCNSTTSQSWYSQKCVCDNSSSGCDISNCYGAPMFFPFSCGCIRNQAHSAVDWKSASWPESNDI